MKTAPSVKVVGHATSLFLVVTFTLCVAFDLLFPEAAMFPLWETLLPGFRWVSWKSFLLGLIESYYYGWYVALVWVPLYRLVARWQGEPAGPRPTVSAE